MRESGDCVLVHTVRDARDWTLLEQLTGQPQARIVVLLASPTVEQQVQALQLGADSVMPRSCEPEQLRRAVEDLLDGRATVSTAALAMLRAESVAPEGFSGRPSGRELEWLRLLAADVSVKEVADRVGYSERMMYRLLRDLYVKLEAKGRVEAILTAERNGWI